MAAGAELKQDLRPAALGRRRAARAAAPADAAARVADHFLADLADPGHDVVSGYWPVRDELDPRPLLERLRARGSVIALPVVVGAGQALEFRVWDAATELARGPFGIAEPGPAAPVVRPDLVLVPMLAFDGDGYRLGYGGGYYDRSLAALRGGPAAVTAVGLAFAGQAVARLPRDAWDQRLDRVVTEQGMRRFP